MLIFIPNPSFALIEKTNEHFKSDEPARAVKPKRPAANAEDEELRKAIELSK